MLAVDTNVLVRLLTRDDWPQTAAAERFVAHGAWVSTVTLMETAWVLYSSYSFDAAALCNAVFLLLDNSRLAFEDRDVIVAALAIFRERPMLGFTDCMILATARQAGHLPLGTFDRKLGRVEGTQLLSGGSRSA